MAGKPNILFMLSDDHAVKAISALNRTGQAFNHTPNLDRIAPEGAVFENSFDGNSICTPSRASILTGNRSLAWDFLPPGSKRFTVGDTGNYPAFKGNRDP